jgi:hypothetical protein
MINAETRGTHTAPNVCVKNSFFLMNEYSFRRSALNMHLLFSGDTTFTKQNKTSKIPMQTAG